LPARRARQRRTPPGGFWLDVIRKEEISARAVPFAWEAEMLRYADDRGRPGLMG